MPPEVSTEVFSMNAKASDRILKVIKNPMLLLLETLRTSSGKRRSFFLQNPQTILQCGSVAEVPGLLKELQKSLSDGYWGIGFLTYEAGYSMVPNLPQPRESTLPAAWFALTKNTPAAERPTFPEEAVALTDLKLDHDLEAYRDKIKSIRASIESGDTYQVNFTMRYRASFSGSPKALYRQLRNKQRVEYAAYLETDDWTILSLSPELFLSKHGSDVVMRPMKGTAPRGKTLAEDRENAEQLRKSLKEQSENLMIVDLLRNDLGRVCKTGSIAVTQPMQVEKYDTLLQMTTTVEGILQDDATLDELLISTFPSGSVTGAPKVSTMQIIHQLENSPRGIYTGAIGYVSQQESIFNVAIRTVHIDTPTGILEMGVGSGILYEADPEREFHECELKAKFLTDPAVDFELVETMLWTPSEKFPRLSYHLDRLLKSAEYFFIPVNRSQIQADLQKISAANPLRIRLLLNRDGKHRILTSNLESMEEPVKICLSDSATKSSDPFLFHKTTHRPLYDRELEKARAAGCFDVIFHNERNEITEGAITNIFVERKRKLFTPPLTCGLLDGTYRKYLLDSKRATEALLQTEDLRTADAIYVSNGLRGLIAATLR
ncbi:MAG: aminodeoxychorismate synthase, component I [Acidobacteria bacterium]|nr:MAG: aminodeoxychorismate synthase, component I [Acidobacteriota bacterium]